MSRVRQLFGMGALAVVGSLVLVGLPMVLTGCLNDLVSGPSSVPGSTPIDGVERTRPNYCFFVPVPFVAQVPPGDWTNTKNCGQACAVMCAGALHGTPVNSQAIIDADKFLDKRFPGLGYATPNSSYTNFSGRNALGVLLHDYFNLNWSVRTGANIDEVVNALAATRKPIIVGVMIKSGQIVASGGIDHWAVLDGYDGASVYLNDPGSSSGRYRAVSLSLFAATWATQGRVYALIS